MVAMVFRGSKQIRELTRALWSDGITSAGEKSLLSYFLGQGAGSAALCLLGDCWWRFHAHSPFL